MRFTLVDKITSLNPGKSITAVKNLSLAEEYLADHFPGFPVMPGVLMIEALVQAGAWLMRSSEDFAFSTILLKQVKAVKFVNFVTPGKTLTVNMEVHGTGSTVEGNGGKEWTFKGSGTVNGESAVSAKLTLEQFNLADKNPELAVSDQYRVRKARELFSQLYTPG